MIKCDYTYSIYFDEYKAIAGLALIFIIPFVVLLAAKPSSNSFFLFILFLIIYFSCVIEQILTINRKRGEPEQIILNDDHIQIRKDDNVISIRYEDIGAYKSDKGIVHIYHDSLFSLVFPSINNYDHLLNRLGLSGDPKEDWFSKELFPWKEGNT